LTNYLKICSELAQNHVAALDGAVLPHLQVIASFATQLCKLFPSVDAIEKKEQERKKKRKISRRCAFVDIFSASAC
jgi:hypothetical protein